MPSVTPVQPDTLAKKIGDILQRAGDVKPVVLVRAVPVWTLDALLPLPTGHTRVVACPSPLAIWDALTGRDGSEPLTILTDLDVQDLGDGILSRVWRQRVETVQPWDLICHDFGATEPDPALADEAWAAEALMAAKPLRGWPQLPGGVLARDTALRHLAGVRLDLERLQAGPDDLDVVTLLRWTAVPTATQAFQSLPTGERDGLVRWLAAPAQLGPVAKAIFGLAANDHVTDAVPLGLVCHAVWSASSDVALRVRGRIEHWFGDDIDDATVTAFSDAAADFVVSVVNRAVVDDQSGSDLQRILERAEQLSVQFGADDPSILGELLLSGLEQRFAVYAAGLRDALRGRGVMAAESAYTRLSQHPLAALSPGRVGRALMALRLARWLSGTEALPASVGDGIDRQVDTWGWVDRACNEVWLGENQLAALRDVYTDLRQRVAQRRTEIDRAFAARLANWTAAGPASGVDQPLLVEELAAKVLAPFGKTGASPVLFVVIDGMSAAVAVELAERLADESWTEYDPIGIKTGSRRRGVVAVLPTITAVSRTSLFAGTLTKGNQDTEVRAFRSHSWWRSGSPELFHKDPTGIDDLVAAINSRTPVVAAVINTVDDALLTGREGEEAGWDIARIGALRTLLRHARNTGRAVIITSDHGHVLERGGELRRVGEESKARYRVGDAAPAEDEVLLVGPRVIADGNRIVALVDANVRYQKRRSGYHGGASLAEVTIPLLAFVPFGATPPIGWVAIDPRPPRWWLQAANLPIAARPAEPVPAQNRRTKPEAVQADALFDVPTPTAPPEPTLSDRVLASELFKAQQQTTARRVEPKKIRIVVTTLLDAGGVLPLAVVAERAGEASQRAVGFATTLQRIFNIDGVEVLAIIDDGRTLRLDETLLRQQFGIP
ncbi:MAG TPA: BREX-2 system phosphatase PglZ [Propionibacteriaceae bacterium]|nr:BREX-2 system phosphatase PglZ [Propionibacteriaceae bacterium]